jgi:hypothetical protein
MTIVKRRRAAWSALSVLLASTLLGAAGCGELTGDGAGDSNNLESKVQSCKTLEFGSSKYEICSGSLNKPEAEKVCTDKGMTLVKVDSSAESDFLAMNTAVSAWIGGKASADGNDWFWHDGTPCWLGGKKGKSLSGFSSWKNLDSFASKKLCMQAEARSMKWLQAACSDASGIICEGPKSPGPVDPANGQCPTGSVKATPGVCGCARPDTDLDGDGAPDCVDGCPSDPAKKSGGQTGCGVSDADSDGDGVPDADDECPTTKDVYIDGACGCEDHLAPAGAPCDDGITPGIATCNGRGVCGDPQTNAPVPGGACRPRERDGQLYWFCDSQVTWDRADALCRAQANRRLVRIEDGYENAFVAANLTTAAWFGGRAENGEWRWAKAGQQDFEEPPSSTLFWRGGPSGDANARYTSWKPGQPASDACARVEGASGAWDAQSCGAVQPGFVCEGPHNPTAIPWNGPGNDMPLGADGTQPGHIPRACESLHVPCSDVTTAPTTQCVPAADAFTIPGAVDGQTAAAQQAFLAAANACAQCPEPAPGQPVCDACQGDLTPPPPGPSCPDPVADPTLFASNCVLEQGSAGQLCNVDADCTNPEEVCGLPPSLPRCDPEDQWVPGAEVCTPKTDDPATVQREARCGKPVFGCPSRLPDNLRCGDGAEIQLCETAFEEWTTPPGAFPFDEGNLEVADQILPNDPFFQERPIPAASLVSYPPVSLPCDDPSRAHCKELDSTKREIDPSHPWCQYTLPDDEKVPGKALDKEKQGRSGRGKFVDFSADPDLKLEFHAARPSTPGAEDPTPGPLGILDLGLNAHAAFKAGAEFKLGPARGTVNLVDIGAGAKVDRCGVDTADTKLSFFGINFLPVLAGDYVPFSLPKKEVRAECEDVFNDLLDNVGRVKKALRDAQELMRQLELLRKDGKTFAKKAGRSLCEQLAKNPPEGFPQVPVEVCKGELPADTINRFIRYYEQQLVALQGSVTPLWKRVTDAAALIGEGRDAASSFGRGGRLAGPGASGADMTGIKFIDQGFSLHTLLIKGPAKTIDQTLFNQTFMIGPIPLNLEVSGVISYGINVNLDIDVTPLPALTESFKTGLPGQPVPLAMTSVAGTPYVGAGIALFVGIGFDFGFAGAKAGINGDLNLGSLSLPVSAGAQLDMGWEADNREIPADMKPFVGEQVDAVKQYVPRRVSLQLRYLYSAKLLVSDILSGRIDARVKLKFLFFSKTWKATLLKFTGFCPSPEKATAERPRSPMCDITLFSGAGTQHQQFSSPINWAKISMPTPFLKLKDLYYSGQELIGFVEQTIEDIRQKEQEIQSLLQMGVQEVDQRVQDLRTRVSELQRLQADLQRRAVAAGGQLQNLPGQVAAVGQQATDAAGQVAMTAGQVANGLPGLSSANLINALASSDGTGGSAPKIGVKRQGLVPGTEVDLKNMGAPFYDRMCECIPDPETAKAQLIQRTCSVDDDCCAGLSCVDEGGARACKPARLSTVRVVAPENDPYTTVSASVGGVECPNATCSNLAPGTQVVIKAVSVTDPRTEGPIPKIVTAWSGCSAPSPTFDANYILPRDSNAPYVYTFTSTLSVNADQTCTPQLGAPAGVQLITTSSANTAGESGPTTIVNNFGKSSISFPPGTPFDCEPMVGEGVWALVCITSAGATPTFTATPDPRGWLCTLGQTPTSADFTAGKDAPYSGKPLVPGSVVVCAPAYAGSFFDGPAPVLE